MKDLVDNIVDYLIKGKAGFFHGSLEWGPRALQ